MSNNNTHRLMPFRVQRSLFAFVVFGLIGIYTISVQWSHVEQITGLSPAYIPFFKIGLASVEVIICLLLIWELWARNHALTLACFGTIIVLEIVCVIHAGAILQLDTNHATQKREVKDNVDAQIRMATEIEKARIAATADAAATLNQLGQRRTARQVAGSIGSATAPTIAVPQSTEAPLRQSFLPEWYLNGAQYFITILLAYAGFAFCFFVSRSSLATEDEPVATSGTVAPPAAPATPVPMATTLTTSHVARPAVGFATGGNLQPATAVAPEPADPKDSPRT